MGRNIKDWAQNNSRLKIWTALSILLLLNISSAALALNRVIDSVEIDKQQLTAEIQVRFNLKLQYVIHSPMDKGDALQIRLRPIPTGEVGMNEYETREQLTWEPSPDLPLQEIVYEGASPSGPTLVLRFSRPVSFTVKGVANLEGVVIIVITLPRPPKAGKPASPEYVYAVNLESSVQEIEQPDLRQYLDVAGYSTYLSRFDKDGVSWNRLRLGFFATEQEAQDALRSLKEKYPQAWVSRVGKDAAQKILRSLEKEAGVMPMLEATGRKKKVSEAGKEETAISKERAAQPAEGTEERVMPAISEERLAAMRQEAKEVMTKGDYNRAIQLYTKLMEATDLETRQEALELLGLARERKGQLAHAETEYTKYLELYPEGEGTLRVRQRLAGLLTAMATPTGRLRRAKKSQETVKVQKDIYGSFSQFYYRDENFTDQEGSIVYRSALNTGLDFTTRFRSDTFDVRTLAVGGYERDFEDESDSEFRASALYVDWLLRELNFSGRLGRQSLSTSGVLGRFDGGLLSYEILPQLTVNTVFGYPVESTSSKLETGKRFYGLSFDLGTFAGHWDLNTFFITQEAGGLTDRRAVGGEIRYFDSKLTAFTLVDYDIYFSKLNLFLFTGNYFFPDRTTLNFSFDYRQSPLLTTSNAIQGQGVTTVDQLLGRFTMDQIEMLALDRTATSRSLIFGMTHPFNDKLQISGDVMVAKLSGTTASGGVEATEGTDYEYYYSVQWLGSSLIKEGDLAIIGLRYADTINYNSYAFTLNTRYPVTHAMRLNPRLVIEYRANKNNIGEQLTTKPSLLIDYRLKKRIRLELEAGAEWSTDKLSDQTERSHGYFVIVGYRWDF